MVNWKEVDIKTLKFHPCGEDLHARGDAVFLPVEVMDETGRIVYRHTVTLKQEFYKELRTLENWQEQLSRICRARVIQQVHEFKNQATPDIHDKMALFNQSPETLKTKDSE